MGCTNKRLDNYSYSTRRRVPTAGRVFDDSEYQKELVPKPLILIVGILSSLTGLIISILLSLPLIYKCYMISMSIWCIIATIVNYKSTDDNGIVWYFIGCVCIISSSLLGIGYHILLLS
jgi:hypothetical protein